MKIVAKLLMLAALVMAGCSDYTITSAYGPPETVYVEVPGETEYVEVPEYGEIWVDHFFQPQSIDGVDILWVIDTSGSMSAFRDELLAGIEAMMNALPESGWRLAMISNHPTSAALENQFPLVPGDDIQDATDMFNAMGTGPFEHGFDATYEYMVNNPYSNTWMRSDAALLVVFVSDEEEQSYSNYPVVADWTTWFSAQRSNGSVFLSSIVNVAQTDSVCDRPPSTINVGHRYMDATNYYSGVIVDICDEDWSPGVTDASSQIEPHEFWELTHLPSDVDTIRVFLDGVPNWDWYYELSDNTVQFTVIPPASALVEIAYVYEIEEEPDTGAP